MVEDKTTVVKKAPSPSKDGATKKATVPSKDAIPVKKKAAVPSKKAVPVKKKAAPKKAAKPTEGQVNVYGLDGKVKGSIDLPEVFNTQHRPDLIRRVVKASRANRRQAYGPAPMAGMRHAVAQSGKGKGAARVQRLTSGGHAAESPPNVGGRRAHPPTPEKDWSEKINKKEKALALKSAIAASGKFDLVKARGHKVTEDMAIPFVVSDDFEVLFDTITKDYDKQNKRPAYTKETVKVLQALGLENEMTRAKDGVHQRAGRGKMRGRRLKKPKSVLFVVDDMDKARKCVGNLPGIDVITPAKLNVELLAPGGDSGRLTVYTEKALASLGGK
ncbi:MAG: 50S ribosomal protein L4 [Thermoplasmata archaeon]|nr:50S ribosomal protein L4 [Thermoplasmata archaeon]